MELEHLEIFDECFRQGNFTNVANGRQVNPTTITRAIQHLERELGFQLFHRTTRKIQPTEAGHVYHAQIAPLLEEFQNAQQLANDSIGHPRGRIRLAAPVSYAQAQIIPLIADFSRRYPEVTFDLLLSDTFYDLTSEKIDIAIRIGPRPTDAYIAHKLQDMDTRVVATPRYLDRHPNPYGQAISPSINASCSACQVSTRIDGDLPITTQSQHLTPLKTACELPMRWR